ncbi:Uncharacterised protein [Serratia quinivorans]|uniref:hypothetical protein n=1 Tax=Serratia quinivorans TaxID=137545 RepID=UPI00217C613D|nr:hypothetical protein [Serratia quinivorans]CAI1813317.1 Uncharacterised protein [Serratia quinivorans]
MQIGMVISWAHRLLTAGLLVMAISMVGYWYFTNDSYDDRLYSKKQLTDDIWLYVTEYQNAGATDTDVYRYYLNKKLEGDPIKALGESAPILTADRADATIRGDGHRIIISFSGKVYSFTNSAFFYVENSQTPIIPTIDFSAQGVNAWR